MRTFCTLLTFLFISYYTFSTEVIKIYPNNIKQSSEIYIKKGDILEISANGKWTLHEQYQPVGPEGHEAFKPNEYGNWGTLLGQIGDTDIFIISKSSQIVSKSSGVLYLFPNVAGYKLKNPSGYLEVSINGGVPLSNFKNNLEKKGATKLAYETDNDYLSTDLLINQGETIEIYAFGYWTMDENYYPLTTAAGHNMKINSVNFGKLYCGIGSSFADFLETFPVGENITYTAKKNGLLSFFPYIEDYKTAKKCKLEIFILGGKKTNSSEIENIDNLVNKIREKEILNKLNEFRLLSKVPSVEIANQLSETAREHARYLTKNNLFTKEEKPELPYFTGENPKKRAENKNFNITTYEILCETNYPEDIVNLLANTVFHRIKLQDPRLKYIGFGFHRNNKRFVYVIDMGFIEDKEVTVNWESIVYPAHDYSKAETSWIVNEKISTLPQEINNKLGSPISILLKDKIKKTKKAVVFDEKGNTVECYILDTNSNEKDKINGVVLIPKKELAPNSKYSVETTVIFENGTEKSYIWSFITKDKN